MHDSYPQWKIEGDLLLKFVPNNLPISSKWNPPTSGHFGFSKTMNRIQERFYCPQMRKDILRVREIQCSL
nr:unnamed protein product [Callosobruchus analis]